MLSSLNIKNKNDVELLTGKNFHFNYLDQVRIYPKYKRKWLGTNLMKLAQKFYEEPIVSFIVKFSPPLYFNKIVDFE